MTAAVAVAGGDSLRSKTAGPSSHQEARGSRRRRAGSSGSFLAPWQVNLATTIMQGNLTNGLSVAELACVCRLSLCYFVRAFSSTVGITPYAWFMQQRIARADDLLINSDLPLAHVALDCGFSDQAHFTKAFAKATGTTPAKRRRARKVLSVCAAEPSAPIERSIDGVRRSNALLVNAGALVGREERPVGIVT